MLLFVTFIVMFTTGHQMKAATTIVTIIAFQSSPQLQ